MSKRNLAILCPWYKSVCPPTSHCVSALFNRETMRMLMTYGDAFVAHARNGLVKRFLESDCDWSIWFDDDLIFPIGNAAWFNRASGFGFADQFAGLHTIDRLLSHGKTLVGGLYFGRSPDGKPMYAEGCASAVEAAACRRGPQNVVKATKWVATGCLLVHRSVYEDIQKRWPHLAGQWFSSSEHDLVAAAKQAKAFLVDESKPERARLDDALRVLGRGLDLSDMYSATGLGEDVQFCLRAMQVGHQPHVDLGLVCAHIGACAYGPFNTYGA